MSIMNVSNLFNQKNIISAKEPTLPEKDKQVFTEIFSKERKTSIGNKQNTSNRSVNDRYTINKSSRNQVNSTNVSNNQAAISHKDTGKLSSKETKKLETGEGVNTKEPLETLNEGFLDDIISMLQSLLANIPGDSVELDNESKLTIDLSALGLEDLIDLKDQMSLLVDTMNFEAGQSLGESIKTTFSMLTDIIDKAALTNSDVISVEKENISEMLSSLKDFKNNVELALKNINSTEIGNLQNLDTKKENNLVDIEEENLSKEDTTLTNTIHESEKGNIQIKNLDKSGLTENNENQNLFQQNATKEYIEVNDNVLAYQQEKNDQIINVSVLKNEIVEPKQFISEIAQKASAFLSKDRNEMNIQLTPENLGKISVKIGLNDGTLTGKIYAENYSVKQIIEANLNQLRDALEENGLTIAGLEVNVGDNSQNFGSKLFQQRTVKSQNTKTVSMENNSEFITLEQDINQRNPYLVSSGQFDGLV